MKIYLRIYRYAKNLFFLVSNYTIFVFLSTIFSVFNIALLIPILDVLFNQNEIISNPIHPSFQLNVQFVKDYFNYFFTNITLEYGKEKGLFLVCIIIVISVFLTNLFRYLSSILATKIRLDVVKNLRMDIYDKVTKMPLSFFSSEKKGDLISRITNDINEIEITILNGPKSLLEKPLIIIIYFFVLYNISAQMTFFTLLLIPTAGGALAFIVKKLKKRAVKSQESLGRIVNILEETFGGMRIIKAFNAQNYVYEKIDKETNVYKKTNFSFSLRRELGSPISEFIGIGIVVVILWFGGSLVLNNESSLSASEFITYLVIFSQIIPAAKSVSQDFSSIQKGLVSGKRVFELIDKEATIKNKANPIKLTHFKDKISFENSNFEYNDNSLVLKNIDLNIQKGTTVALVGPSGSGKSTLVDLIPRFYDLKSGDLKIDGVSIKNYDINSVRNQLGIVTQEGILFNDTVFNNIAFGIKNPNEEEVYRAANIANAHHFIEELNDGYHTNIGERGLKLSGGQRQRLSIARAIMKNPPILILDEATSALDTESEQLVQEAIYNLMKNRTSIVIAHRLSTIQRADTIVVIEDGKIIEKGNHKSLLAKGGLYKKLTSMQNG